MGRLLKLLPFQYGHSIIIVVEYKNRFYSGFLLGSFSNPEHYDFFEIRSSMANLSKEALR